MTVTYSGNFGQTTRKAVSYFIHGLPKADIMKSPFVTRGPESQILVFISMHGLTKQKEAQVRRVMSKISADVLGKYGVWVIGVPKKPDRPD